MDSRKHAIYCQKKKKEHAIEYPNWFMHVVIICLDGGEACVTVNSTGASPKDRIMGNLYSNISIAFFKIQTIINMICLHFF